MKTRNILMIIGTVFIVLIILAISNNDLFSTYQRIKVWLMPGFTDTDIETAKTQINNLYAARENVKVIEVNLIRESARKLTGYVKVKNTLIGLEFTQPCTVTMSDDAERKSIVLCNAVFYGAGPGESIPRKAAEPSTAPRLHFPSGYVFPQGYEPPKVDQSQTDGEDQEPKKTETGKGE